MKKLMIAAPRAYREELLQFLQEESVLHVIEHTEEVHTTDEKVSDTSYHLAQLQFVLDFIIRMKKMLEIRDKRSWKNMFAGKPTATLQTLENTAEDMNIAQFVATMQQLNDELAAIDARMLSLQEEIAHLAPWKSLMLHNHKAVFGKTKLIHHLLQISVINEHSIDEALARIPTAMWQVIHRDIKKNRTTVYGELVAHTDDAQLVEETEKLLDAELVTLPVASQESIAKKHAALLDEKNELGKKRAEFLSRVKKVITMEEKIRFAYDALLHRAERERVSESIRYMPYSIVVSGWIPETWLNVFSKRIATLFPDAVLEATEVDEREKAPVLFQNSKIVKPFEVVTDLYGKPGYHELDPTGPLAIFFLVAFALALTDAGYGVLIMVATTIAQKFFRLKQDMQKMMRLLFFGGAMTVVMGALTGGWFSINLVELPEGVIKNILLGVKLLDPLAQPMVFLGIIFGFGVIQLIYAWIVRGMYHWKKGEKHIAIQDDFSWAVLVISIIVYIASSKGFLFAPLAVVFKWLTYGTGLCIIWTQGRASKNIFLRIGGGILSLNGLIAFVSDMLSYSRLLALGLATGIIGLVVNLIASMVHESIPVVGIALAGVVLIVGHVFNLGINALGAFIHSGRLQFVEFFPKFLEGGGVAFRPFGRVGRYVDNPKDFSKEL